jgi:cyclopropane-fatty-acyl-phospholipid synthase
VAWAFVHRGAQEGVPDGGGFSKRRNEMVGSTRLLHEIGDQGSRPQAARSGREAMRVKAALDLLIPADERRFGVRLWDGSFIPPAGGVADWVLVLNTPAILSTILLHPDELTLGEAFLHGNWAVEGDLEQVFGLAEAVGGYHPHWRDLLRVAPLLIGGLRQEYRERSRAEEHRARASGEAHTRGRDRQAIRYHYDVGNDFYALWLDRNMIYSCAYFETAKATLDQAQEAKLDLICRKLRLKPGERFLDVGCGWGALIRHAAAHYGVNATGITLSEAQAKLARERIVAAGLADRCQVEIRDYRDLPTEWFDKAASVGMAEHVGTANLGAYFAAVQRALKPGGLFLNHAIADSAGPAHRKGVLGGRGHESFIERHVFPDGELQPIHDTLAAAEDAGLEVCDVESLRRHYALTLRHWGRRLEARRDEALAIVDETTYRVWQLYMAGAAHGFARGNLNIYQTLLSRPGPHGAVVLPLTREDLYQAEA